MYQLSIFHFCNLFFSLNKMYIECKVAASYMSTLAGCHILVRHISAGRRSR